MKDFNKIKASMLAQFKRRIEECQNGLQNPADQGWRRAYEIGLENNSNYANNIDEVTRMEIGKTVNSLIELFKDFYTRKGSIYVSSKNYFYAEFFKQPTVQRYCEDLGINTAELIECFKRELEEIKSKPNMPEFGDEFRKYVNNTMKTGNDRPISIPMGGAVKQAQTTWETASASGNKLEEAQAYVTYQWLRMNAGETVNGYTYLLSNDNNHLLEARKILASEVEERKPKSH